MAGLHRWPRRVTTPHTLLLPDVAHVRQQRQELDLTWPGLGLLLPVAAAAADATATATATAAAIAATIAAAADWHQCMACLATYYLLPMITDPHAPAGWHVLG